MRGGEGFTAPVFLGIASFSLPGGMAQLKSSLCGLLLVQTSVGLISNMTGSNNEPPKAHALLESGFFQKMTHRQDRREGTSSRFQGASSGSLQEPHLGQHLIVVRTVTNCTSNPNSGMPRGTKSMTLKAHPSARTPRSAE